MPFVRVFHYNHRRVTKTTSTCNKKGSRQPQITVGCTLQYLTLKFSCRPQVLEPNPIRSFNQGLRNHDFTSVIACSQSLRPLALEPDWSLELHHAHSLWFLFSSSSEWLIILELQFPSLLYLYLLQTLTLPCKILQVFKSLSWPCHCHSCCPKSDCHSCFLLLLPHMPLLFVSQSLPLTSPTTILLLQYLSLLSPLLCICCCVIPLQFLPLPITKAVLLPHLSLLLLQCLHHHCSGHSNDSDHWA